MRSKTVIISSDNSDIVEQHYDEARNSVDNCGISFVDYKKVEAILKAHFPYAIFRTTFSALLCDREIIEHYFNVCKPTNMTFAFNAEIRQNGNPTIEVKDSVDFIVSKQKTVYLYYSNSFSNESVISECSFDNLQATLDQAQASISKTFFSNNEMSFTPSSTAFEIQERTLFFGEEFHFFQQKSRYSSKVKVGLDGEIDAMLSFYHQGLSAGFKKESVELFKFIQDKLSQWCIENKSNLDERTEAEKMAEILMTVK
ncbi:MAG: hypothetical protein HAW67_03910 [Endozoicomonadaceae bacterium]|nr:hypothetical protein [Endozoicomonadaceae bacterium]